MNLLIAANWKMHKTVTETVEFCRDIRSMEEQLRPVDLVVCPPFTALAAAGEILRHSPVVNLGAQNMHWEKQGAFTGEIAAPMLKELEVKFVILGHSERRQLMGESDEAVKNKVWAALDHGLIPILCVGETERERQEGQTGDVLKRQLHSALQGLSLTAPENLVVAYEPVWAIGTGVAASAGDAEKACAFIREEVRAMLGEKVSQSLRVQYGGSVSEKNIGEFVSQTNINGALVGGASLKIDTFTALARAAREAAGN